MDDRFYIIVSGHCAVERHGERIGMLSGGECFGETSYVPGAKRTATIRAADERHGAEGQLDAARAGLGFLPAALQSGVPARSDQPPAERPRPRHRQPPAGLTCAAALTPAARAAAVPEQPWR